jgi:hypothetical protein
VNTSALRAFAPAVRRSLQEAIGRKLDVVLAAQTPDFRTTYAPQVAALRELARTDRAGLVERVAYTWFNRCAALRYLDARGWHPFHARVLTPADADSTQPELLKLVREGALPEALKRHTDPARLDDLLDGRLPSAHPQQEVYRHLVLAACRYYHALLPDLFERLDDTTELLLPDDLLTEHAPVAGFRTEVTDDDCGSVEVLGWLYQFYISEKKDAVMARKTAVPTADIPAVTQLFTPHWIVRYLVENSLGRLWLLNRPQSGLRAQMPYYVETEPETDFLRVEGPEDLKVLDPAVGSGHMLVYAFDLLYAIYEEEGYAPSEIPGLILRYNLYGVDIDPRAAQLAQLALVLKAREKARRFFQPEALVHPSIIALQDVTFAPGEIDEYVRALRLGPLFDTSVRDLLTQFEQATTFGSLIEPVLDERSLAGLRHAITQADVGGQLLLSATHEKVLRVIAQAKYLTSRHHVVVANPPYMGAENMSAPLRPYCERHYQRASANLFSCFIERNERLTLRGGQCGMVTLHNWMFLDSFRDFRKWMLVSTDIHSLVHLGPRSFDTITGEVVQTAAFVFSAPHHSRSAGIFFRLVGEPSERAKEMAFLSKLSSGAGHMMRSELFSAIPGAPIAYWLPEGAVRAFRAGRSLSDISDAREGLATGNNEKHVRAWYEVAYSRSCFGSTSRELALRTGCRWFPYNKGGTLRRWYGNLEHVVNWENDGKELRTTLHPSGKRIWAHNFNLEYIFKPFVSWSDITTRGLAGRFYPEGFLFDATGLSAFFSSHIDMYAVLALLNTRFANAAAQALNPTLHFKTGDYRRLPLPDSYDGETIEELARRAVDIARADWDDRETSWSFARSPLLKVGVKRQTLSESWECWRLRSDERRQALATLETQNNLFWNTAFQLTGETDATVSTEEVTLTRAERKQDSAAFLSFAVGCMMGRYSIDLPGLVLADEGATLADYQSKIGKPVEELVFVPDSDGILPVLDGEWFEDDVVARVREFLRVTFGEATLRENVRWLEESLGKELRKYFLTDFYKDHLQTYKKRPIYWLVQSPKKGFSVLVYLHRYSRDTLNVVLNRYLREYLGKLRSRIAQLAQQLAADTLPTRDRTAARKEHDRLVKVLHECEEWERQVLLPLAQQRVELDLDDGVKVNYQKLAPVLAPIPGLTAAED